MRGQFKVGLGILAGISAGLIATGANAQALQNGDFGTGDLTSWGVAGNTSVQDQTDPGGSYFQETPPSGNQYIALVSGGPSTGASGPNAPATPSALDTALGISDSDANSFVSKGFTAGSVIFQQVFLNAGQAIGFNANFLTDQTNDGTGNAHAGAFIVVPPTGPVSFSVFASPTNAVNVSNDGATIFKTPYNYESGWFHVTGAAAASSGLYTIAIAEGNTPDNTNPSAVLVDNVVETPEPASLSLLGLGALGLLARRRRSTI